MFASRRLVSLSLPTGRAAVLLTAILAANLTAWAWALIAFAHSPVLLGLALLAYSFGLRHALDADHIAAIDNVSRKLLQQGGAAPAVGFWFALGHSTLVMAATVAIVWGAAALQGELALLKQIGETIAMTISAAFLLLVAIANGAVLLSVWRGLRSLRRNGVLGPTALDGAMGGSGLLGRMVRPLFGLIGKSWHMYPVGILFGLSFDTATEIGLLGIAAGEAAKGLELWSILVLPALFAAAMVLVDTADGMLMQRAYGWALHKPARKLYYNLIVTAISVAAALLVGAVQLLALLSGQFELSGPFWEWVGTVVENFGLLGLAIVALFAVVWLVTLTIYKLKRLERLDPSTG